MKAQIPAASERSSVPPAPSRAILAAGLLVIAATLAAFCNSFTGPFIFDDIPSITDNPTIRQLGSAWSPPHGDGLTVEGRPLVNFSLAVNHAFGGTRVEGYHVVNLVIHFSAALTLLGIVRRTLLQPALHKRYATTALPLATGVAIIWAVHPLQTESVDYIVQRAESLMGLCYLLTLYGFIRGTESRASRAWFALAAMACLLGMASKEVMVSAPLIVFLYDRTFVAGSFREAWRQHKAIHIALASTWLLLAWLVAGTGDRGGTAGFGTEVAWWSYGLTQFKAIVLYLRLAVWPHPLVLDYGTTLIRSAAEAAPAALAVMLLAIATLIALRRRSVFGFLGAWFFIILAPSSSVVPVATQTMAEHRMYLPLAAVVVLAMVGLHAWLGRRSAAGLLVLAAALSVVTVKRNADYRTELSIWSDTAAKSPDNPRAHHAAGINFFKQGRLPEAIAHFETTLRLDPSNIEAHNDLGVALAQTGRSAEAVHHYEEALKKDPGFAEAHHNLANILVASGQMPEALAHYEAALKAKPAYAEAHYNLGNALAHSGRYAEAAEHFRAAIKAKPDLAEAHNNLGIVLIELRQFTEAVAAYEAALKLKPAYADAHYNLGRALIRLGRQSEGIAQLEAAVRLNPNDAEARHDLDLALGQGTLTPALKP